MAKSIVANCGEEPNTWDEDAMLASALYELEKEEEEALFIRIKENSQSGNGQHDDEELARLLQLQTTFDETNGEECSEWMDWGSPQLEPFHAAILPDHDAHHPSQATIPTTLERPTNGNGDDCSMKQSTDGRAWLPVREILRIHETNTTEQGGNMISSVGVDDLVLLARNLIHCQERLKQNDSPYLVTIGYHYYTPKSNVASIREHGLMTPDDQERISTDVSFSSFTTRRSRRSHFGKGIYLGSNPYAFHRYRGSDVGLMVAVIYGT